MDYMNCQKEIDMKKRIIHGCSKDPLKTPGICWKSDIEKFKNTLKVGTTYELTKIASSDKVGERKVRKVEYMRLIAKHPHIATFEDENGHYTSYGYWELQKLLKGEEYS